MNRRKTDLAIGERRGARAGTQKLRKRQGNDRQRNGILSCPDSLAIHAIANEVSSSFSVSRREAVLETALRRWPQASHRWTRSTRSFQRREAEITRLMSDVRASPNRHSEIAAPQSEPPHVVSDGAVRSVKSEEICGCFLDWPRRKWTPCLTNSSGLGQRSWKIPRSNPKPSGPVR